MYNPVTMAFDINTTDANAELGVEVWIDTKCVYQNPHVTGSCNFSHTIDDDDSQHQLRIIMSGKTTYHTKIDAQGNIIQDALLTIKNPTIDGISVDQLFVEKCVYTHDFNGNQAPIVDKFHGVMGCNGTVSLPFTTPIYLWLMENM